MMGIPAWGGLPVSSYSLTSIDSSGITISDMTLENRLKSKTDDELYSEFEFYQKEIAKRVEIERLKKLEMI